MAVEHRESPRCVKCGNAPEVVWQDYDGIELCHYRCTNCSDRRTRPHELKFDAQTEWINLQEQNDEERN